MTKVAVVLVRGRVGLQYKVKDTLDLLRLRRKNFCVVLESNSVNLGMINKVKDFVTWGEITDETFKQLVSAKAEEWQGRTQDRKKKYSYKTLEVEGKHYKPYFRLNPPRKGFGRKGIKMGFKAGGALGNRGEKMNDLIERMI
ncbi:50S ribosomal protein L30 [Candidatus Woesearchaeota archaeon]|jgi:large subunit ribosomal protein L30|nr:50S ribosomal protein L30 [Candidatus Woesearchaeota archaeon]MBT5739552.1 50S ribosomal protein L30 [Candidatus Woesearchaeota archaeon]